jgi:hypothetical protein
MVLVQYAIADEHASVGQELGKRKIVSGWHDIALLVVWTDELLLVLAIL